MLAIPLSSDNKKDEAYSPTMAALKCASEIMQQRIISNPKDMIGVLLFGTKKSRFQDDEKSRYPNCYLLNNLDVPGAQDVKTLREVLAGEDEYEDLLEPCGQPVSMSNLLFCANQIFTTSAPDFGSRRLFIITDKDDPHGTDKDARKSAAVRAKDLYDLGVIIELFPISHPDHEFDKTKFYDVCRYTPLQAHY
jgi:ATP-dependent DNA helicase 2 subunit 1